MDPYYTPSGRQARNQTPPSRSVQLRAKQSYSHSRREDSCLLSSSRS